MSFRTRSASLRVNSVKNPENTRLVIAAFTVWILRFARNDKSYSMTNSISLR